jgi:hypothetical protein
MSRPITYLAAPPSLGLRPRRAAGPNGEVRFLAGDQGNRGFAKRAVMVRVRPGDGATYRLDDGGAPTTDALWPDCVTPLPLRRINGNNNGNNGNNGNNDGDGDALYEFELRAPPEAHGAQWLLVLIYGQINDADPGGRAPSPAVAPEPPDKTGVVEATLRAVDAMLRSTPTVDLHRFRLSFGSRNSPATIRDARLCFAFGSCQYPSGIVDCTAGRVIGESDVARDPVPGREGRIEPSYRSRPGPADETYHRLARLLDDPAPDDPRPSLLLLLGDQVYVDDTAGLFDPSLRDGRFRAPYERWLGSPCVQEVLYRLPLECVIDDHEIIDNWEPDDAGAERDKNGNLKPWAQNRKDGTIAFRRFQLGRNGNGGSPQLWRSFDEAGVPFFLMNTRTEREHRDALTVGQAKLIRDRQFGALQAWLLEHKGRPKFIASPSILLPRQRTTQEHPTSALRSDAWDGYPATLHALLAFIWDQRIEHCVFISGDEHLSCIAEATLRGPGESRPALQIYSIHSSGFYAPYPFANSRPEDLAGDETFEFSAHVGGTPAYRCEVQTWFPRSGDGFATIALSGAAPAWRLKATFHGRDATLAKEFTLT